MTRTIEGPWGPLTFDPDLPRRRCGAPGCLTMVLVVGYTRCQAHRRPCAKVMPRAGEQCASRYGHTNGCRTRDDLDNQRNARWYGVR